MEINLTKGQVAIVDPLDYEVQSRYKWCASKQKCGGFYAMRKEGPRTILMHRAIALTPDTLDTDHINGNKLDNRRRNLRIVTRAQNNRSHKRKMTGQASSKYRGVTWSLEAGKWTVGIKFNSKRIYLGLFINEDEAAMAYDRKAIELGFSKEFLNFKTSYYATATEQDDNPITPDEPSEQ